MNNQEYRDIVLEVASNIAWKIYVKIKWRKNKPMQERLDADTRDNLGYYLSTNNSKFNF